jgi:hypothetical protein
LSLSPRSTSYLTISGFDHSGISYPDNFRNYILVIIPVAAAAISIIIWKKRKD